MTSHFSIYALHGFLGIPSDWQSILPNSKAIDVFSVGRPAGSIQEWAECFNESLPIHCPNDFLGRLRNPPLSP